MEDLPILKLKRGKENHIKRQHPWLFSGALEEESTKSIEDGQWVWLSNFKGEILATGYFAKGSIAVRILSFHQKDAKSILIENLQKAIDYRKDMGFFDNESTNAFRLVFAEGDNLPGLIIDWYAGICVLQCHTMGMLKMRKIITSFLESVEGFKAVYLKSEKTLKHSRVSDEWISGNADSLWIKENGLDFYIDIEQGQKTGFFIDQRENRALVKSLAKGRKVLNTFCYTGGFSVYAAAGGAEEVTSVDVSVRAMEIAEKNIEANASAAKTKNLTEDVFEFLTKMESQYYDLIILDPPAFAKRKSTTHNAVMGYKRLNMMALEKVKSGGIIVTFSCSQNISFQLFYDTVRSAAIEAGRNIKVVNRLVQPTDHPVSAYHPEGEYLKGLVLYVA